MRSKSKCGDDIVPKMRHVSKASNAWKGIMNVWSKVYQNLVWRLGNGHKVKFWKDHWILGIHSLEDLARTDLDEIILAQTVNDYTIDSGEGNWNKVGQNLSTDSVNLFITIKAPNVSVGLDRVAWFPNVSGEFTQKSAYKSIVERDGFAQARVYKEIWRISSPQRLKVFIWVVVNDTLLTYYTRFRRRIAA